MKGICREGGKKFMELGFKGDIKGGFWKRYFFLEIKRR